MPYVLLALAHLFVPQLCLIPRKGVRVERNIVYRQDGRLRLKLDVFHPAGERTGDDPARSHSLWRNGPSDSVDVCGSQFSGIG